MRAALPAILIFGVTIYALIDCARADESQVKTLPRWGWLLLISIAAQIGPIAYLNAGRNKPEGRKSPKRRMLPPDDDPDFLGKL